MSSKLYIVIATFNGKDFIAQQIDSIIAQTAANWILLIRDDGSTDETYEYIKEHVKQDPRVRLISSGHNRVQSASKNFSILLSAACEHGAEYIFCCDQDDVWEPNKLELMLAKLKELEGEGKVPALVHHDLTVVDGSLEPIADSFVEMMQLQPSNEQNPQRLISRNEVTGCAMACNRALLDIALPIPEEAVMHDWWLALCAGFFGRIGFMPERLVKYRQHGDNAIGAKSFWHGLNPFTNWIAGWKRGDEEFISTVKQAKAFRESMSDRLASNPEACAALDLYAGLIAATRWQRLRALRQFNLWRNHWLLNLVLVMRMILLPRNADL